MKGYVKNHLGSICVVLDSEADSIVQSTYYRASGVPFCDNLDEQPYLYNGKEFVEVHGWNNGKLCVRAQRCSLCCSNAIR